MFDYQGLADNVVQTLLLEFGLPCIAITKSVGEYNPETGEVKSTEKQTSGLCVKDNISYKLSQSMPNLIQQGDILLICSQDLEIETGSIVTVDGEDWVIIDPRPIRPANVICAYEAIARLVK